MIESATNKTEPLLPSPETLDEVNNYDLNMFFEDTISCNYFSSEDSDSASSDSDNLSKKSMITVLALDTCADDTASTAQETTVGADLSSLPGSVVPEVSTDSTCKVITSGVVNEEQIHAAAPHSSSNPQNDTFGGNNCQEVSAVVKLHPQDAVLTQGSETLASIET